MHRAIFGDQVDHKIFESLILVTQLLNRSGIGPTRAATRAKRARGRASPAVMRAPAWRCPPKSDIRLYYVEPTILTISIIIVVIHL